MNIQILSSRPPQPGDNPAQWAYFMGDNHNTIYCAWRKGGSISFARHLGKPLSQELWDDLIFRLGISKLRVYKHNQGGWTDSVSGLCRVYLDSNSDVMDICWGA